MYSLHICWPESLLPEVSTQKIDAASWNGGVGKFTYHVELE
jgi:hypothetical protein